MRFRTNDQRPGRLIVGQGNDRQTEKHDVWDDQSRQYVLFERSDAVLDSYGAAKSSGTVGLAQ